MSDTKTLIFVGVCLVLLYFVYTQNCPVHNEGNLEIDIGGDTMADVAGDNFTAPDLSHEAHDAIESESIDDGSLDMQDPDIIDEKTIIENRDYSPDDELKKQFGWRNKGRRGPNNYRDQARGQGPDGSAINDYIAKSNSILGLDGDTNDFSPIDETGGHFMTFKPRGAQCGSNQDCNPENLFNADNYLPQEVNKNWFDVQPEPISVKNRHLINVTRPIGVNTIGTSLKNASRDIRGTPACPKFVVSPFLNSSISPDTNIREWGY